MVSKVLRIRKNEFEQETEEGRRVPGFEVDDNQHTNKESSPVSIRASEDSRTSDSFIESFLGISQQKS